MPLLSMKPQMIPPKPITEPTDRSNMPSITTSIMPMAMITLGAMTPCSERILFDMKK